MLTGTTVSYGKVQHEALIWDIMSYCAKLTDEELSRYLNKTESVGLRKAQC